ncbi:MAG TPA: glycosyl hydrolase [Flavisolibacter sp.]|nr:glycosyl hydrolase [Flavisolibacter sp.]
MQIRKHIVTLFLGVVLLLAASAQSSSFVRIGANQFRLNNQPYYYIGTNYWYGGLLGLEKDPQRGKLRLQKELDFLKAKGVQNLRIVVGAEGSGLINGVERIGPPLQPSQGRFNEQLLKGLDLLLAEMGKRNLKAVLFLSNNWEWSGGFQQYLIWNNQVPDDQKTRKLTWDEQRDIVSKFYTCEPCKEAYNKQVTLLLNRTNSLTKLKYVADPAIMAWELANEPRPMRPSANDAYQKWIADVAAMIKRKDKNHLVTIGHEGYMGTENMDLFETVHADKNIDYITIHIWPKNWSWFRDTSIAKGFSNVVTQTKNYIEQHAAVAQKLQKPLVLEEFGLPRDGHSFDPAVSTTFRDRYYDTIFSYLQHSAATGGVISGAGFWAFGGTARPKKGQIFWKKGDDYMGDPPMEEQGLNTVFDSDSSTWNVISSYAGRIISAKEAAGLPVDKKATKETVALYKNLKRLLAKGIMFGHQDDLAYGVGWKYQPGRSDVKDVTGDYPAVYGFELGKLEVNHPVNLDSVPFDKMRGFIEAAYNRGGVVTLSWHLNNPLTGKTAWDPAPGTVASILPGGEKHTLYQTWLDNVAAFLQSLKGKKGEAIPVIFRPFHELNGNWFWWGASHCTPDELKQLYQFTVRYLRDTKNIHHLLYAFNTDRFSSKEEYLERYPGDEWVDLIGFDSYQRENGEKANANFVKDIDAMLTNLESIAAEKNKIPALTEFGYGTIPDSTWWTGVLWKALQNHRISFALAWRNAGFKPNGRAEFYVPYKGEKSAPDFVTFFAESKTLFQKEVTKETMYK